MTRTRLVLALLAATLAVLLAWHLQPERRLMRSWNKLLDVVEARHARALGALLAEDYADRWGYTKASLVQDARLAFHHFRVLEIRVDQQQVVVEGDQARVTALLRIEVQGSARADEARVTANALFSPFVLEWRREDSFPWSWKLVRFDQPELDLERFRRATSGALY